MKVAVIGTGYVGLVSGACLAEHGHHVTCVDIDPKKIEKLRQGVMPIFEPGLEELVKRNVANGRLFFSTSYAEAVPEAEFVSIAVGTPSAEDGSADLQYVFQAAEMIGKHLSGYTVIADKSTVPVGTAERVEEIIHSVFEGEFDVISNPEILREGHAVSDFLDPTRIIIGSPSERATEAAQKLYAFLKCPKLVMSRRSAELTKYVANAFLATKISYMNARAKKRVVERIEKALGGLSGKRIALLGLSFKNNTDDTRESAALELARHFLDAGATVAAFDPVAAIYDAELESKIDRKSTALATLIDADALVLATEWDEFRSLDLEIAKEKMRGSIIMDARNLLDPELAKKMGFVYLSVGRS
jgi:UDP-glucose 6-dehydrogenase